MKGTYFVYLRTAQGSKNAPLTWGREAALVCRMGQSLFDSVEVWLRCYVDDPNTSVRGTRCHRNRCIALLVMLWRCVGLDLAFSKGARGTTVEWIGVMLTSHPDFVKVTLKQSYIDELRALISDAGKRNLVRLKELRSLAGKANRGATLV